MRFSVGYCASDALRTAIFTHIDSVCEVYFPLPGQPSGRGVFRAKGLREHEAQEKLLCDLEAFSRAGIALNLLLNANCYGALSQSRALFQTIGDELAYYRERFGVSSVTTASPLIARFVKRNFPEVETRASVNIGVGTPRAADSVADCFDGYYLKRELNRDARGIERMTGYCEKIGKKLYLLANSGCLNDCAARTFHDNLVAHEREIAAMDNGYAFEGVCRVNLKSDLAKRRILRDTNFVRPEDMGLYEKWFPFAKLATRSNPAPERVLEAYARGRYAGNLLDLTEPDFAGDFYPLALDNGRIEAGFAERVLACDKRCEDCDYCERAAEKALVRMEEAIC